MSYVDYLDRVILSPLTSEIGPFARCGPRQHTVERAPRARAPTTGGLRGPDPGGDSRRAGNPIPHNPPPGRELDKPALGAPAPGVPPTDHQANR